MSGLRRCALLGTLLLVLSACPPPKRFGGIYLGGPTSLETQITVDVFKGSGPFIPDGVYRLRSTATLDGQERVRLMPPEGSPADEALPLNRGGKPDFTVVGGDLRGTVHLVVDGLDRGGRVVARAVAERALEADKAVLLEMPMLRACAEAADCMDSKFCTSESCNANGICEQGPTCPERQHGCVVQECREDLARCERFPQHDECGSTDFYCDGDVGCTRGTRCEVDADCVSTNICENYKCNTATFGCRVEGEVPQDDGNPCTVDDCKPDAGVLHLNLGEGARCSPVDQMPLFICRNNSSQPPQLVCLQSECGDGVTDSVAGEQCDDGNLVETDACSNACNFPRCGDRIRQDELLGEECDDGNTSTEDTCIFCRNATCGDGHVNRSAIGTEGCDDGPLGLFNDADGCDRNCQVRQETVTLLLGCPAGVDAGPCVPVTGITNLSLQAKSEGTEGTITYSNQFMVAAASGFVESSLADPQVVIRTVPRGARNLFPDCTAPGDATEETSVAAASGAPDSNMGSKGLLYFNDELTYTSTATGQTYLLRLAPITTSPNSAQIWNWVGTAPLDCCRAGEYPLNWRGTRCSECRDRNPTTVPSHVVPMGKLSLFLNDRYTFSVALDPHRRLVHAMQTDLRTCAPPQSPNITLQACAGFPDAIDTPGVGPDGGPATSPRLWKHLALVPNNCLPNGTDAAFIASETDNHLIVVAGIRTLEALSPGRCLSVYNEIAGVGGTAGNGAAGSLAVNTAIRNPTGAGQDSECNVYFADSGNNLVRQITASQQVRNVVELPGLVTLVVHPSRGVLAATNDAVYLITQ